MGDIIKKFGQVEKSTGKPTEQNMEEVFVHYEDRIARLEREKIQREAEVSGIEVFYEGIQITDAFSFQLKTFCTQTASEHKWFGGWTGNEEIVPMLQACEETW